MNCWNFQTSILWKHVLIHRNTSKYIQNSAWNDNWSSICSKIGYKADRISNIAPLETSWKKSYFFYSFEEIKYPKNVSNNNHIVFKKLVDSRV